MKHRDLLDKIQKALQGEKKVSSSETHSYAQTTAFRVPYAVPKQQPVKTTSRKTDVVTKEWNKEVKQTSNCSSHMESEPTPGSTLIPARVHRWNIKNYASIAHKMQALMKPQEGEIRE